MGLPFFDTDLMVCERLGIKNPIDQIRASFNGSFVRAQWMAVCELEKSDFAAIVATGAEVALMPGCAEKLRRMGTVIHIRRNREAIIEDLAKDDIQLIMEDKNSGTKIVMREESVKLYEKELSQYEALTDHTFENNGDENDGLESLLAIINQKRDATVVSNDL